MRVYLQLRSGLDPGWRWLASAIETGAMLKKILVGLLALLLIAVGFVTVGLWWAHRAIKNERALLPPPDKLMASVTVGGAPNRLSYINTATQPMPRAGVLDPKLDPSPEQKYVMSHPSFVLQWPDGR